VKPALYKLAKVSGGVFHYAEVFVQCAPIPQGHRVEIGSEVFAWLKDVYGADAWEWACCDGFRRAARAGAEYAIAHSTPPDDYASVLVTVTKIHAAPADTTDADVAYAACYATWDALQTTPTREPRFEGRNIIFDE
jgi:hypothetical protein